MSRVMSGAQATVSPYARGRAVSAPNVVTLPGVRAGQQGQSVTDMSGVLSSPGWQYQQASMAGALQNTQLANQLMSQVAQRMNSTSPLDASAQYLAGQVAANATPISNQTANQITQAGVDQLAGGYNQARESLRSGLASRGLAQSPLAATAEAGMASQAAGQAAQLARQTTEQQALQNFAGRMQALESVGRYNESMMNRGLPAATALYQAAMSAYNSRPQMSGVIAPTGYSYSR